MRDRYSDGNFGFLNAKERGWIESRIANFPGDSYGRDWLASRKSSIQERWDARRASRVTNANAPNLSSKVSDIIAGKPSFFKTDVSVGMIADTAVEGRLGAKSILETQLSASQLKELLDSGATYEEILDELRVRVKSMPPLVTPPVNAPITTTSKASTTITSSEPVVSVDAPPKVTPIQVTTRPPVSGRPMVTPSNAPTIDMPTMPAPTSTLPSQPPPLSNMPIEPIQPTPKVAASRVRGVRTTGEELDIQTRWNIYRDKQFQKSLDEVLDKDIYKARVIQAKLRGDNAKATVARLVRKQKERAEWRIREEAKKEVTDNMNKVTDKVIGDKSARAATTKLAEEVSSIAKIESAGLFSREGKLASKFLKQGPLLKVGAIAAGAWILLATLNSAVKTVTSIGADDNPPNYVSDVYNRIEHEHYSPMEAPRKYNNPSNRRLPNNQLISRNRIGHTRYSSARSNYDLQNLYQQ